MYNNIAQLYEIISLIVGIEVGIGMEYIYDFNRPRKTSDVLYMKEQSMDPLINEWYEYLTTLLAKNARGLNK